MDLPQNFSDHTHTWAQLAWRDGHLDRLEVAGAVVHGAVIHDPLLGDAHVIETAAARTTMSALDWARPTRIPAIAHPGRLPSGAGSAILNAIARLAAAAGIPALRYAGPYPTPALWTTLARSFRCDATCDEFTADLVDRMQTLARDEIAIDFHPAPHARIAITGGVVEHRDHILRALIDGIAYEANSSPARLVGDHAEVWFGDVCYARVATLAPDGTLLDGPHAIPACTSEVVGKSFPPALVAALAELVADAVPTPLADAARHHVTTHAIVWADLGARAARTTRTGLAVHAAIWQHVAPHGMARLALALAEALAPVVTTAVLATISS